ncbi:MAG: glycosyl hydrolase, partial [Bacteroidota bacterium]
MISRIGFILLLLLWLNPESEAQRRKSGQTSAASSNGLSEELFKNYKFRNIGPAFMSGRISDLAIHPENENVWYVAVGSGGVWKTENAGVTFTPIFDKQISYSIGCVSIDPTNPNHIWVGTGENVGGRHVGFGDGIYKSEDGGATWENKGLPESIHISKIDIHPENAKVIRVAVQGPLWYPGGDRGFYLSTDGGDTWKKTLGDDQYTGVTDFAIDPRDPDRIYAATWQHHRTVAALISGGPKTGIYLSTDGGSSWKELKNGLPEGNMGKIGLTVSPIDPDVVYAAIELNRRKGGVYRSADRGGSWKKMSDAVAGATGPHYYQELYASPHKFDRLYLVDNWMQISEDGGKTFTRLNRTAKHGDNHAVAFKKNDPNYLLVGTDGGVYESFDLGANWRFMENLPVTQFYKVAVDDTAPFYNIYGGTQDNSTQGGPSRTDNLHGIRNADWKVVLNWDGHQPAVEPGNPDIIYAERQEGNLSRVDMTTGEVTDIQPQPSEGEPYERFNWDAPILVSPHVPTTIYFASQRVWKSEDRGDSWEAISGDLTKNEERLELPIMGRKQSWDAPWDVLAMSNYNTITSLAESPVKEGVIYAGTDDGILQVTENGGGTWKRINVAAMGVPATSFINDVKADLYDESTVYVALDNHKYGDFKPYLVKSTDKGATWTSMTKGLTKRNLVWRVVQDHEVKDLMFAGTEFGVYFTIDGGRNWTKLKGGTPTISFRDLAIQRRENDLVAASFGRGFFILDDYSALRKVASTTIQKEAELFAPRDAWWYIPRSVLDFEDIRGSQGSQHFVAPNPDFGAVFTYYLQEDLLSKQAVREQKEKALNEQNRDVPFPGWDALEKEKLEKKPELFIEIKNSAGEIVNRVMVKGEKGFNRAAWDLTYAASDVIKLEAKPNSEEEAKGMLAKPGVYTGTLYKMKGAKITQMSEPVSFNVKRLYEGALPSDINVTADFWKSYH